MKGNLIFLVLISASLLTACMDLVGMEIGRRKVAEKYPECANLSPGETLNCKDTIFLKEGAER